VHLGIYEFDGDPDELLAAYDRMMIATANSSLAWHLCAVRPDGIVIYDTCPSEEAFDRFSTSPEFLAAVRDAGLPEPRVTGRPVHAARGSRTL
jgi:hypothetical protein